MMQGNPKIVALIPLRGGSESIPYKNIKPIAGKPLAYWVLNAASSAKCIDQVYVSTDDQRIKETIHDLQMEVTVLDRPDHLATSRATTESVMLHFADSIDFDILFMIQATSPVTHANDFDQAYKQFSDDQADSLLTGVVSRKFLWDMAGKPINYDPLNRPMRQDFTDNHKIAIENGAFYITKKDILQKHKCRLGGKISLYKMHEDDVHDIDEPRDWDIVEKILIEKYNQPNY